MKSDLSDSVMFSV